MNPGRYFMPNFGMRMINPMAIGNSYMIPGRFGLLNSAPRSIGLFNRIANGIRGFNWRGLLSGANRTLNVVNQTIPLIRQARPMVNNMKSMLNLARAFRNETGFNTINRRNTNHNISNDNTQLKEQNLGQKKEVINDNYPNFFI